MTSRRAGCEAATHHAGAGNGVVIRADGFPGHKQIFDVTGAQAAGRNFIPAAGRQRPNAQPARSVPLFDRPGAARDRIRNFAPARTSAPVKTWSPTIIRPARYATWKFSVEGL